MWPGRGLLHAKFHLDPSNCLVTIHQRYRQTGQTDRTTDGCRKGEGELKVHATVCSPYVVARLRMHSSSPCWEGRWNKNATGWVLRLNWISEKMMDVKATRTKMMKWHVYKIRRRWRLIRLKADEIRTNREVNAEDRLMHSEISDQQILTRICWLPNEDGNRWEAVGHLNKQRLLVPGPFYSTFR